jgi:hypothetical protein
MTYKRCGLIAFACTLGLIYAFVFPSCESREIRVSSALLYGQDPEKLSEEQMRDFLLKAKIVNAKPAPKGVTSPSRLTLSNGTITHDAGFQQVDEYKPYMQLDNGTTEMNFRDKYQYDIAAYELAKLLGLGDMMPVTVERKWKGNPGALSWWLTSMMDEKQRLEKHIDVPNPEAWYKQVHKMTVFEKLVYDTDRNRTNVLITADWHLFMIDFSRAFRLYTTLKDPKDLVQCDRQLLQKLRQLNAAEVTEKTKKWLNKAEIKGLMARRDKIVALFDDLIAKKGETQILYDSAPSGN